jgi:hypothetical protein
VPLEQPTPQPPQLLGSWSKSVHPVPGQQVPPSPQNWPMCPGLQPGEPLHVPALQTWPAPHE